ncbi:MAG: CPBP family intramembrane metalloprotease [Lachnospiraceae bacterium]|nr:CPBP family intramembrane metalloprotease [Lachnospiraceae bacterium]
MKDILNNKTVVYGILIFFLVELANIAGAFFDGNLLSGNPTPVLLLTYLAVSVFEETVFRIVPAGIFGKRISSKKGEICLITATSLAFGLFHLVNLLSGASLSYTVLQMIFAASIGSFFCLLYLRSGSAILIVVMHIAHDVITGFNTPELTGGVIYSLPLTLCDIVIVLVQSAVFLVFVLASQGVLDRQCLSA